MKEREEYSQIVYELFELVKKDSITTLAICPLNKKKGSFPASLMARMMIYYLNEWVGHNLKDSNTSFKLSMIKIVCDTHAYARAFCTELLYMDEEMQIGRYDMKGLRRMSEEIATTIDEKEVELKKKENAESRIRSIQSENSQEGTPLQSPNKPETGPSKFIPKQLNQVFNPQPEQTQKPVKRAILRPTQSDDEDDSSDDST